MSLLVERIEVDQLPARIGGPEMPFLSFMELDQGRQHGDLTIDQQLPERGSPIRIALLGEGLTAPERSGPIQQAAPARTLLAEGLARGGQELVGIAAVSWAKDEPVGAVRTPDHTRLRRRRVEHRPDSRDRDLQAPAGTGCGEVGPEGLED